MIVVLKFDTALDYYENACRLDSNRRNDFRFRYGAEYTDCGRRLFDNGQFQDAVTAAEYATKVDSMEGKPYCLKGDALKKLGRTAEAEAAYASGGALGPGCTGISKPQPPPGLPPRLGYCSRTPADTTNSLEWFEVGNAYFADSDFKCAADAYLRALKIDSSFTDACRDLVRAYEALGWTFHAYYYRSKCR